MLIFHGAPSFGYHLPMSITFSLSLQHSGGSAIEQNGANTIGVRRPAWLFRHDRVRDSLGKPSQLGRFARAFDPFEGEKHECFESILRSEATKDLVPVAQRVWAADPSPSSRLRIRGSR